MPAPADQSVGKCNNADEIYGPTGRYHRQNIWKSCLKKKGTMETTTTLPSVWTCQLLAVWFFLIMTACANMRRLEILQPHDAHTNARNESCLQVLLRAVCAIARLFC